MPITYFPQINSSGVRAQYPYSTESQFLHSIRDMDNSIRDCVAFRLNPLWKFNVAFPSIRDSEVAVLRAFFVSMAGKYGQFAYLDPTGNLCPSSDFSGVTDPFGGTKATVTSSLNQQVLSGDANGIVLCTSIYVKPPSTGSTYTIGFDSQLTTVVTHSTDWQRISGSGVVSGSAAVHATVSGPSSGMFGFMCSPTPGPGFYVSSPAALGLRLNCRFDTDVFQVQYVSPGVSSVTLPVVENGFVS